MLKDLNGINHKRKNNELNCIRNESLKSNTKKGLILVQFTGLVQFSNALTDKVLQKMKKKCVKFAVEEIKRI